MQLSRFDLNLLVVFDAIYTENNLTRAGEVLNMAQPSVSNALARLRAVYDDPLFVRSGRGVAPTPTAQRMIEPIRQSLRLMQSTLDGNLAFQPSSSDHTFRISVGELGASSILPKVIELLNVQAPGIHVHAFQMDRREVAGALAAGQIDLAIDIAQLSTRSLNRHPLEEGDHVCVLRRDHPRGSEAMTLALFMSLEQIVVSSRSTGSSLVELALSRIGERITPKVRVQYYLPGFNLVQASDHTLVAPRSVAEQFDVLVRELPFEPSVTSTWLYWHRNVQEDPANAWLRAMIIDLFGKAST